MARSHSTVYPWLEEVLVGYGRSKLEIKENQEKAKAKRLKEMQCRESLYAAMFQSACAPAAGVQNAARLKQRSG